MRSPHLSHCTHNNSQADPAKVVWRLGKASSPDLPSKSPSTSQSYTHGTQWSRCLQLTTPVAVCDICIADGMYLGIQRSSLHSMCCCKAALGWTCIADSAEGCIRCLQPCSCMLLPALRSTGGLIKGTSRSSEDEFSCKCIDKLVTRQHQSKHSGRFEICLAFEGLKNRGWV